MTQRNDKIKCFSQTRNLINRVLYSIKKGNKRISIKQAKIGKRQTVIDATDNSTDIFINKKYVNRF